MIVLENIDPNTDFGKFYLACKDTDEISDSVLEQMFLSYKIGSQEEIDVILEAIEKFRPKLTKKLVGMIK